MLPKEPSFCIYNTEDGVDEMKENQDLVRSVTIGDIVSDIGSSDFSFGKKGMGLIEEDENEDEEKRVFYEVNELGFEESEQVISSKYHGGVEFEPLDFDGNGDVEEYYKRVLKEDPCNPLFLRNYAQLLQVSLYVLFLLRNHFSLSISHYFIVVTAFIPFFSCLEMLYL